MEVQQRLLVPEEQRDGPGIVAFGQLPVERVEPIAQVPGALGIDGGRPGPQPGRHLAIPGEAP